MSSAPSSRASLWLPRYLIGVYGLTITTAGMIAAAYTIPASLFRIYGGVLSDKFGARRVMYWTFGVSVAACFVLAYPPTQYLVKGISGPIAFTLEMGLVPFTVIIFVLGFFMSLGKAAVYKHIPVYYPGHVGAVGGVVGLVGGMGGFVLPIAFGLLNDLTGIWTSCFMLLFRLRCRWCGCTGRSAPWRASGRRGAGQVARTAGNAADPRARARRQARPRRSRTGGPRTSRSGRTGPSHRAAQPRDLDPGAAVLAV